MNDTPRERILSRLDAAGLAKERPEAVETPAPEMWRREEKIRRLQSQMEAMRTEVHVVEADRWLDRLKAIVRKRKWKEIVCGAGSVIATKLQSAWEGEGDGLPKRVFYEERIESFKEHLFAVDAGVTSTVGAVADTGAVILWPTPAEPRTLSLVPPVHIALVDADQIFVSLEEAMQAQGWKDRMPTNALLISGPSKTADIEFTLVFGVHGPKEMIVLILI